MSEFPNELNDQTDVLLHAGDPGLLSLEAGRALQKAHAERMNRTPEITTQEYMERIGEVLQFVRRDEQDRHDEAA